MFSFLKNPEKEKASGQRSNLQETLDQIKRDLDSIDSGNLDNTISKSEAIPVLASLCSVQNRITSIIGNALIDTNDLASSSEELNDLAATMRESACRMNEKATTIDDAAKNMRDNLNSISAASEELNVNMNNVSERAKDSTENIKHIAMSTEEMTSTISEIANNTEKARGISQEAASKVTNASEKVASLGTAAADINEVVAVINEISEQTKLLALNATIEAARAGEAGKGFAVVAGEVKDLARQTSDATEDIRKKIEAIQQATQSTIEEIDTISGIINEVNDSVTGIAAAVEEQSVTTQDISTNITNTVDSINDITRSFEESAIAVDEMSKNISSAALHVNEVTENISEAATESTNMRTNATKVYASAIEVAGISEDMGRSFSDFKLPSATKTKSSTRRQLIKFSEAFSVGVKEINSQHSKIMDFINEVHALVKAGSDLAPIKKVLNNMAEFVVEHFATEERYFKKFNYKDYDKHKGIHENLLGKVKSIMGQIEAGEEVNLIEVLKFLRHWLQNHILIVDKKYQSFMNENGIF